MAATSRTRHTSDGQRSRANQAHNGHQLFIFQGHKSDGAQTKLFRPDNPKREDA